MDGNLAFETWAPRESLWSRWAKGVLFSFMGDAPAFEPLSFGETWLPPQATDGWALVIDLPGSAAVRFGLGMAGHGYRPIPLFTSLPVRNDSEVPMAGIMKVLEQGAVALGKVSLPAAAPPAFLLDSRRLRRRSLLSEQPLFDNRTLTLSSEFPSAEFLRSQGIQGVLVVQSDFFARLPPPDLARVLRGWLEGGLQVRIAQPEVQGMGRVWTGRKSLFERLISAWRDRASVCLCGRSGELPKPSPGPSRGSG